MATKFEGKSYSSKTSNSSHWPSMVQLDAYLGKLIPKWKMRQKSQQQPFSHMLNLNNQAKLFLGILLFIFNLRLSGLLRGKNKDQQEAITF